MPVIGFLNQGSPGAHVKGKNAFEEGLRQAGYVVGRNVSIELLWAETQYDRLPAMASELIRRQVAVIIVALLPAALAAKDARATIPKGPSASPWRKQKYSSPCRTLTHNNERDPIGWMSLMRLAAFPVSAARSLRPGS
jgi:hypothetical protein